MNNQIQPQRRQNQLTFTGNVSQVKPLQNSVVVNLAYNEGKKDAQGQFQQTDTLFMEAIIPASVGLQPNIGDRVTVGGFLASNNFTPQGGKKRYGVKIVVQEILEFIQKQPTQQQPQSYNQPQQQYQQPQQQYQQPQQQYQQPQQQYQQQNSYNPQQR